MLTTGSNKHWSRQYWWEFIFEVDIKRKQWTYICISVCEVKSSNPEKILVSFVQSILQQLQRINWVILKLSLLKFIHEKRTRFGKIHIEYLKKITNITYIITMKVSKRIIYCVCVTARETVAIELSSTFL